jgi:hypothetical protein
MARPALTRRSAPDFATRGAHRARALASCEPTGTSPQARRLHHDRRAVRDGADVLPTRQRASIVAGAFRDVDAASRWLDQFSREDE